MIDAREILEANSNRNIGLLCRWLYSCIDNSEHYQCRRSLTGITDNDDTGEYLPSRVIHVGALNGSQPARLYITNREKGRYVALSHRWGKSQKVMTLRKTLGCFTTSLPMDELSMTFEDAIQVTRNLGMSYLWIDSLCIYPIRSRFSCRRFWRHLPPKLEVLIATFLTESENLCS
jgi:hypothetical protein